MYRTLSAFLLSIAMALGMATAAHAAPVNINKASADEIAAALSGVGSKKAKDIVAFREKHGPFKTIEQLEDVKGIGQKMIEKNKANIRLQ